MMTSKAKEKTWRGQLPCQPGMHVFLAQRVEKGYFVDYHCCFCGMFSMMPDEDGFIAYGAEGRWH
jgi:hypothetical protein